MAFIPILYDWHQRNYFVASGGQSGWLEGCAARKAGCVSNSRSIRNIIGKGRKST